MIDTSSKQQHNKRRCIHKALALGGAVAQPTNNAGRTMLVLNAPAVNGLVEQARTHLARSFPELGSSDAELAASWSFTMSSAKSSRGATTTDSMLAMAARDGIWMAIRAEVERALQHLHTELESNIGAVLMRSKIVEIVLRHVAPLHRRIELLLAPVGGYSPSGPDVFGAPSDDLLARLDSQLTLVPVATPADV